MTGVMQYSQIFKIVLMLTFFLPLSAWSQQTVSHTLPRVEFKTSHGNFVVELYENKTPITVANFLDYVNSGHYNGIVFHRVIPGFMVQTGGFDAQLRQRDTKPPIKNEANAFLPNVRGSIAMARTSDPHSATSQFFINLVNNSYLNKNATQAGYAVFGKVIEGMSTIDRIATEKTGTQNGMRDVPINPVVIESATLLAQKP